MDAFHNLFEGRADLLKSLTANDLRRYFFANSFHGLVLCVRDSADWVPLKEI